MVSGSVLAWSDLPSLGELISTTYGHLLLTKLALLAVALDAAFVSRT